MPLADVLAAVRWWLALFGLGVTAAPLVFVALGRLADRGYAFSRMIGLLIVAGLFWLGGSLGFLSNTTGSIWLAFLALAGLSLLALRRRRAAFFTWLRTGRRQILLTELVFLTAFALWTWVRAQNPAITATEKPMEFAFLNAVGNSPTFPPLDPWLSGYAISYYYFGYVMTSVIARLAAVTPPIAFNLGIAWLFAGTAVGAFGLVYNLCAGAFGRRLTLTAALAASLALPLAGNMQILLETLHGNGVGSPGFWTWLAVRDLQGPAAETPRYDGSGWWWWRSSRVINETHLSGRVEEGLEPIAEFPAFSFILGDMHPHVLALPYAFLSLALALAWWKKRWDTPPAGEVVGRWRFLPGQWRQLVDEGPLLALTVAVLGGLSFLNTWDVLIHLFVVVGAVSLARWRDEARRRAASRSLARDAALLAVILAVPAVLLYLPFYLGFRSQAGAPFLLPFLLRPTRLSQFLIIFIMPLLPLTALLVGVVGRSGGARRQWRLGLGSGVIVLVGLLALQLAFVWLIGLTADGAARLGGLAAELGIALPALEPAGSGPAWSLAALARLLPALLGGRLGNPWLALYLATLIGLAAMALVDRLGRQGVAPRSSGPDALPFVLLLVVTGALLTLGPEFVYLRDNFGQRLNTVFKFYYQAWALFGVAALYALALLWQRGRGAGAVVATVYAALLAVALTFPYHAVVSRQAEYGGPATLDGLAYVARSNPDEYAALQWLRSNSPPTAIVLEAVGGSYTGYGRVSANTGRPTLLGWPGHEIQWRGYANPEPGNREPVVSRIYTATDWDSVAPLLDRYGVDFVYVGGLEQVTYGQQGLEKFAIHMPIAFQNGSVTIFRWAPDPTASDASAGRGPS